MQESETASLGRPQPDAETHVPGHILTVLDHLNGRVLEIHLTEAEEKEQSDYEDFEEYIADYLEQRYGFDLTWCSWMESSEGITKITFNPQNHTK